MSKVVISGYYGFNNAGDEAVLFSIIKALKNKMKNLEIVVLSNDAEKTAKLYGVKAINRWKIIEISKELRGADLLISGGGSLLQDVTSKNGILYYLGIIFLARLFKTKTLIYAQGFGPVEEKRNQKLVKKILEKTEKITLRDEKSKKDLEALGLMKEIQVVSDPVLGLEENDLDKELGKKLLARGSVALDEKILGISLRNWENPSLDYSILAKVLDKFSKRGFQIVFIPMHYPEDISAAREAIKYMEGEAIILKEDYSPEEMLTIFKEVDLILGMRLHSLIMGAVVQKPLVAISYDPKVDRFMESLQSKRILKIEDLAEEVLDSYLLDAYENKEDLGKQKKIVEELQKKAQIPAKMVCSILQDMKK